MLPMLAPAGVDSQETACCCCPTKAGHSLQLAFSIHVDPLRLLNGGECKGSIGMQGQ